MTHFTQLMQEIERQVQERAEGYDSSLQVDIRNITLLHDRELISDEEFQAQLSEIENNYH